MITKDVKIRVRYNETDKMGIVHHSNYIYYYEMARTELMRSLGVTYREMEEQGVFLIVREVQSVYYASAYYDDVLTVRVTLKKEPTVKSEFDFEIFNEEGTLLNTGKVILASVNAQTHRPCKPPQWFIELYRKHSRD